MLTGDKFIGFLFFCVLSVEALKTEGNVDINEDFYFPQLYRSDSFDWTLFKRISPDYRNVLMSPLSLKLLLGIVYEGASGNTLKEMQEVLMFPPNETKFREDIKKVVTSLESKENKDYIFDFASKIFLDDSLLPQQKYQSTIKSIYNTTIKKTPFSSPVNASHVINHWVANKTHGKITKLVSSDDIENAAMIVANAFYFKGSWRLQFPRNKSYTGGFYLSPTEVIHVPYMNTLNEFYFTEALELDSKILRLPYKGNRFSLFIILPNSKAGLLVLIQKLNSDALQRNLNQMYLTTVDVTLPKLKIEFQARYAQILEQLGIKELFQHTASLPGIVRGTNPSNSRRLQVSDVIQKAGIELNEEGSVIFAASDIELTNKFGSSDNYFNATHPFLFYVEEQSTGSIIFMGKVENPLEGTARPLPTRFGDNTTTKNTTNTTTTTQESEAQNLQNQPLQLQLCGLPIEKYSYFDLDLLRAFTESAHPGNIFISPASIKSTLALILEGARGLSAVEIRDALKICPQESDQFRSYLQRLLGDLTDRSTNTVLESSNAVFVNDKLKVNPEFQQRVWKFYNARIDQLNFSSPHQAAKLINSWASNATHGLIKNIVSGPSITQDISLLLSNVLYFKGKWKTAFNEKLTRDNCFILPNNQCVQVPFMQVTDTFNYSYNAHLNSHIIDLPYEDEKYSMLLFIPIDGNVRGVAHDLQHTHLIQVLNSLSPNDVVLEMPKFDIDFETDLIDKLHTLRIQQVFGSHANLSGIVTPANVHISDIIHKTRIEVTEQGTRAAAATSAIVIPLMGSSAQTVIANHAFMFFIYNIQSKNIVFEGVLIEPKQKQPMQVARAANPFPRNGFP